jgi:hypothetical protein
MYQHVPTCTNMYQHVPTCTNMYQHVPTCTNMYQQASYVPDTDFRDIRVSNAHFNQRLVGIGKTTGNLVGLHCIIRGKKKEHSHWHIATQKTVFQVLLKQIKLLFDEIRTKKKI